MEFTFFDEERNPQNEATPTLSNVIKRAIDIALLNLRFAMPATVIEYDKDSMKATVQPLLKHKYKDGTVVDIPVIYNVPVAHPRAGKAYIHMPIQKGDNVLLIFSDKSLEKWLSSGGNVDPDDVRNHDLSDAIAYPGLYPFNDTVKVNNSDDVIIYNGGDDNNKSEIRLKKNNHVQVLNKTNELITVLSDVLKHIREARTITGVGLQALQHPQFANDERKLRTFLER